MVGPGRLLDERTIHLVFEVSLWLKGVFALSEVIAGVATYFISQQFLLAIVLWVTKEEFAEDPHAISENSLLHAVQNFSVSTQKFVALYLLGHGIIKLWLIIGLLRRRLWYYPVAIIVFALFIAYQLLQWSQAPIREDSAFGLLPRWAVSFQEIGLACSSASLARTKPNLA